MRMFSSVIYFFIFSWKHSDTAYLNPLVFHSCCATPVHHVSFIWIRNIFVIFIFNFHIFRLFSALCSNISSEPVLQLKVIGRQHGRKLNELIKMYTFFFSDELGYIGSLRTAKFIRYIRNPIYTRELLWFCTMEVENFILYIRLIDITESDISEFY